VCETSSAVLQSLSLLPVVHTVDSLASDTATASTAQWARVSVCEGELSAPRGQTKWEAQPCGVPALSEHAFTDIQHRQLESSLIGLRRRTQASSDRKTYEERTPSNQRKQDSFIHRIMPKLLTC
jgi:hypothetical protein